VVVLVAVVVVAVVVMDFYVTVDWMQYKFLSTYPLKKFETGQVSTGTRAPLREYIVWWSEGTLIACLAR